MEKMIDEKLGEYLSKHELFYDDIEFETDYETISIFKIKIVWGDWKHDHARLDWLVEEWAKENSYELLNKVTTVIEDDGSDCYSAIHMYIISK